MKRHMNMFLVLKGLMTPLLKYLGCVYPDNHEYSGSLHGIKIMDVINFA